MGIRVETLMECVLELFGEAYEGSGYAFPRFIDREPDAALLGTLAGISAEEASLPLGVGGITIAAHTQHLRWSLAQAAAALRGEPTQAPWEESGSVRMVDPAEWDWLREALRAEYAALARTIREREDWSDPDVLLGTLSLAPHAAYHLGAIRQIAGFLKGRGEMVGAGRRNWR